MADLDPLDLEIVERALQGILEGAVSPPIDLESDEELELALRRELAEMIRATGVSDADALLDILIASCTALCSKPASIPGNTAWPM